MEKGQASDLADFASVLITILVVLTLLTALFAFLGKHILSIVFGIFAFGAFGLQYILFSTVVKGSNGAYEWSFALYTFIIAFLVVLVGNVWAKATTPKKAK